MPEPGLDVLKYQFPPPDGRLLKTPVYAGGMLNKRTIALWEIDIEDKSCLVVRSITACWYFVESAVRSDTDRFQAMSANTVMCLYPDVKAADLAKPSYTYVSNLGLSYLTTLYPLNVAKAGYADNEFYQPPSKWEGPIVIGGERKVVVALRPSIGAMSEGAAIGEVAASVFAWQMPDLDQTWKEAHKL